MATINETDRFAGAVGLTVRANGLADGGGPVVKVHMANGIVYVGHILVHGQDWIKMIADSVYGPGDIGINVLNTRYITSVSFGESQ